MAGKRCIDTKEVGGIAVAGVTLALKLAKKTVLLPPDDNLRFDIAVYVGSREIDRIQCKTGRLANGVIYFNACSTNYHYRAKSGVSYGSKGYKGDADYFGVYCIETGKSYLVPVGDVGTKLATLRIDPPRNNQKKNIRWASVYEIHPVPLDELYTDF